MKRGFAAVLVLGSLQLFACSDTPDFVVSRFDVQQLSWDSLTVNASFEELRRLGPQKAVVPDDVRTTVYTAAYDTLYSGDDAVISIADEELGDGESLIVEICGQYRAHQACEQRAVNASPKRLLPETELHFPETDAYDRGTYRLDYRLMRRVFDGEGWESIDRRVRPETYVVAYVENSPSDAVKVPVRRAQNRFNLTRFAHYRDLRYQIKSRMMDADSAVVSFDLYTRLGAEPERVASNRVVLRERSEEERRAELYELVELAGGQLLDRLKGFFGLRKAYVFINEWSYQPLDRMYKAEIELHWQSGLRSEWLDMIGNLAVMSNGTAAQFEWVQGSTAAARRWVAVMDSSIVNLQPLYPGAPLRPPDERVGF